MWGKLLQPFIEYSAFAVNIHRTQTIRTAFVVQRRFEARLRKSHKSASLRKKHFVYDTVQTNQEKTLMLNILLQTYVEDVGQPGEVVTLKERKARLLLLTKAAVYASSENISKLGQRFVQGELSYSSRFVGSTIKELSKFVLNISINREQPWVLERWHIRSAFRRVHVNVPEYAVIMPKHQITGPDTALENKEFLIYIEINNKERVPVRCRLHHWSTNPNERLPHNQDHWKPAELLFPEEDHAVMKTLPEIVPPVVENATTYFRKKLKTR